MGPGAGEGACNRGGGANGGYLTIFGIALVGVSLIGLGLGASVFFAIAISLISIAATMIAFFLSSEPCGDARDDVNLFLNLAIAGVGGAFAVLGKQGETILIAVVQWIYGTGVSTAIEGSCRR